MIYQIIRLTYDFNARRRNSSVCWFFNDNYYFNEKSKYYFNRLCNCGVLAIVLSQLVVSLYGLRGASILYLLLISVLAVFFSIAFYFNLKIWKEGITNEG